MSYDDQNEHNQTPKSKSNKSWLIGVVGAVIGSIIMFILLTSFTDMNMTLDESNDTNNTEETENANSEDSQGQSGNSNSENVNVDISTQTTEVVDSVSNAIVGVVNIQEQNIFGRQQQESGQGSTGSGVVYKEQDGSAYVVTNHHVIEGASSVEVVFQDETQVEAEVVGSDMYTDLAVLRIDNEHVSEVIELGQSDSLDVGEPVVAIGNPLGLQFAGSVTKGVVSGKDRLIPVDLNEDGTKDWQMEVLQTDAAINPGNSGGALVNMKGQLVGINSMKISSAQLEGLGFAIPIGSAKPIMDELEADGAVTRPYVGISPMSLADVPKYHWQNTLNLPEDVQKGVVVASVENMSPAAQGGLEQYDVIVEIDGQSIENVLQLRQYLYNEAEAGQDINVTYYRNGEQQETTISLTSQEF
ncbi:S1C family serine protease [Alkalibacillus almallahensis]|uniref:S1C family serine protease n=1 Tax=Alkalibacillus almallahensis TaxID=1379154 RepID=UPI0014210796|nr:S1C family serine protease [Alkalibacillus almallahensis]NIK11541.1 serine protease Do [Alkalibacillus almallahensis]